MLYGAQAGETKNLGDKVFVVRFSILCYYLVLILWNMNHSIINNNNWQNMVHELK